MKKKIRSFLVFLKNNNPWLLFLWSEHQRYKGIKHLKKWNDVEAVNKLYRDFSGKYPNLNNPKTFSEKQQWLKLNYHNPLMTIGALIKWEVRESLHQRKGIYAAIIK